jgi:tetratricopeptide (TPR) repeat protein
VAPNQIYLKALALYSEGKYWDAYFLFAQIQNDYPDFFKGDWVGFYAGSCQEHMDMRDIALDSYQSVKVESPQSTAVAPCELGIMRINYRNEDYQTVTKQFEILSGPNIPDSLKYSAAYLMGETFFQQKQYDRALNLFKVIPFDHPDYIFAEHSAAVALLSQDKIHEAAVCLQNCLSAIPQTDAQKEMANRSNLFLSYMLYEGMIEEPQPLSKVVTLLRKIPDKSVYHEDALLLLGWTAIKARQTTDAVAAGTALQNSRTPELYFEGCLITVYANVMQNKFNEAKAIIVPAMEKIAKLAPPSEDSLSTEKQQYISTRTAYNFLAQKIAECAQKQQAGAALSENSALHDQQRTIKSNLDASLAMFDSFKKDIFLTRNLAELKQDFNYMLAYTSQKAVGTDLQKEHNKTIEKQKKADEKIEKLKKQLEEIENKKK